MSRVLVIEDSPDYLPPNSYASARVIVGVDASAGVSSQTDPLPVVLRITGPARSVVQNGRILTTKLEGCIVNGAGENAQCVEALRLHFDTRARHQTECRFESHHPAKRGRPDHRARCLGAHRDAYHAGCHGSCRTRRRSAGCVLEILWVARFGRIGAGQFGGRGFADDNGACRFGERDTGGIKFCDIACVNRRAADRGHARYIDDVFHAERDAVQRPALC